MPIRTIVYSSCRTSGITAAQVADLVYFARSHNIMNGITGMLFHTPRGFCQVIEAVDDAIDALIARIDRDPRHVDVERALDRMSDHGALRQWQDYALSVAFNPEHALAIVADPLSAELTAALRAGLERLAAM